jgi:rhodanese-related sulfurtransferase/DNA-binding transcriptional ArsR family regulator
MKVVKEQELKDALYEQFARIGKAVDSPKRIELLELLGQGERSVESLALSTAMGTANTSAHLKVLRQARLVETRKLGTKVLYRLADDLVARFLLQLRELAHARLAEVESTVKAYLHADEDLEQITREELLGRAMRGDVLIVDVRPQEEYDAGHIPGAVSIPFETLAENSSTIPTDTEVVAYCRGPYCVLSPKTVRWLRSNGYQAIQLEDGFPEWRLAGLPVAVA